jgi:hypothetical protein
MSGTPDGAITGGRHVVYWLYDVAGALLYVGMTNNAATRWKQHATSTTWWAEVSEFQVRGPFDRARALEVEREAIGRDRPLHNRAHRRHCNGCDCAPEVEQKTA